MLEPCEGKLSCTVLRGESGSNTADLLDQILENKQKFISQIMTSKSPVRSCEDVDDAALSYAEIKALATGNVYIKEKMELDIQVSRLKLLKAGHTNQKYRLETEIARGYPAQIAELKERIAGLKADTDLAAPVFEKEEGKDNFAMEIMGKNYTDRKEAGAAFESACWKYRMADKEKQIGSFHGFTMKLFYNALSLKYMVSLHGNCDYRIEIGNDGLGNMQRISNALARIPEELKETQRKLETVQNQLAIAKEEVEKPFAKETELQEKLERLAELNVLLNMDEKSPAETVGLSEEDREEEEDIPAADTEENMEENMCATAVSREKQPILSQIPEWDEEQEEETEFACTAGDGYFAIQETEGGYDYTFYDKDYKVLDGGVYENPDMDIVDVMEELLVAEGMDTGKCGMLVYDSFMEKAEKAGQTEIQDLPLISDCTQPEEALSGQSRAAVEEMALCYAQAELEAAGLDEEVELLAARVYGSRTREGLYREDSDIDVAISYVGNIREDSFSNMLDESGLKMAGIPVDMNPVSLEETGTLVKYLADAERYLDHKEIQMREAGTVENTGSKDSVIVEKAKETGERRSVLADLKERQARLAGRENPAERSAGYKREGVEL